MKKDLHRLIRIARRAGWTVTQSRRRAHWKFKSPSGVIIFTGATPSDPRAVLNARAHLRRAGLKV